MDEATQRSEGQGPLFLLDGNNIAYRAFYALPQEIATSSGFPTNALYGFCLMVTKILGDYHPQTVIVAWDSREKTFRHEEFEEYKAQRKPMPDLLSEQWPFFCELAAAFGFVNLALPGWEADDILATLARQAEAHGRDAVIVTGDKDALQLASRHVSVMSNTKGMTEVRVYDPAAVEERFGVPPRLIPDLIGLKGDSSDNIPGVPGIGEKTASELLCRFGSLEEVLRRADEVSGPKRRELLKEHRELALLSKKLASLEHDAPLDFDSASAVALTPQREKLVELLARFEFTSLFTRIEPLLPACDISAGPDGQRVERVAPAEAPQGVGGAEAPASVLAPALAVRADADAEAVRGLLDWSRPVGLAVEGEEALWVAWPGGSSVGGDVTDYGRFTVARIDRAMSRAESLRGLLGAGPRICHDLKSAALLHGLVEEVAHDTYLAGYLLDPGQRAYALDDLARGVGVPVPVWGGWRSGSGEAGGIAAAATGGGAEGAAAVMPGAGDGPEAGSPGGMEETGAVEAALSVALAATQAEKLREQGMWQLFTDIELPLTRVLITMEKAGVQLDCYRLGEMAGKVQDQLEGLEASIYEAAGEQFNLGSPQQLGHILFDKLGLPRQRKTKTGYSTDAKTLEALRASHPIVEQILSHRELSKLASTYLLALPQVIDAGTGRLHTTFHQAVTATGRLSSSDPNLQNIPVRTPLGSQIRNCFGAEPGHLLVVADYSQIELRVMAYLSGETALLESFAKGEDIHTRTAAEVFGLPEDQVDSKHRRYAKAVNFGIMYGQTAFGLSQTLGIEREEAADYIDRYFERLPKVKAFIEETIEDAKRQGYVATVFGRRRYIPELRSDSFQERSLGERLAVNSVIQGSAADIIKVAMIRCQKLLDSSFPGARLVLQVHDELVFEVPEGMATRVRDAVVEEMVGAYPMEPPLGVDAGVGADWAGAK